MEYTFIFINNPIPELVPQKNFLGLSIKKISWQVWTTLGKVEFTHITAQLNHTNDSLEFNHPKKENNETFLQINLYSSNTNRRNHHAFMLEKGTESN